ncbi:MAG: ABC transporter ATP-binding protein [Chloroflexota bacterium]|nr:MAG: ABC transporter ATP-binding protein [Chloroflexota bacterium]
MHVQINHLVKYYDRGRKNLHCAVNDLSLELSDGMFGLLGPNGAGKTTLMKMLATLLEPTSGSVSYDGLRLGRDNQAIRKRLGYLPQSYGLYANLSAREVLDYMAALHGMPRGADRRKRIDAILEQVNLLDAAGRRVGGFSGGMRQRLGIAQALLNDPDLLIVDEPTAGLDPEERIRFRNLLGRLSGQRVVILSTHIVGDISSTCDDMAVLAEGTLRFRGQPVCLIDQARGYVWSTLVQPARVPEIERDYHVISAVRRSAGVSLRLLGDLASVRGLPELAPEEPNLEDAYIWTMRPAAGEGSSISLPVESEAIS